jgi:hypothetical protein
MTTSTPTPASNPVNSIWERILGWLPAWLGFVLVIGAGVVLIVAGIIGNTERPGFIAFGIAAIASAVIAWWSGAKAEPRVNPFEGSFGAVVSRIEQVPWLIIFGLFLIAVLVTIFT